MRTKVIASIGIIVVVLAALVVAFHPTENTDKLTISNVTPNQTAEAAQHHVNVVVKTDGTDVSLHATATDNSAVPAKMIARMNSTANADIQSETSTVNSVKADIKAIAAKYNYTANVTVVSQFGTDQLPFPATVDGTSMVPTLEDGQDIVAVKTKNIKVGDIVIAEHPSYGLIVKRVAEIRGSKVYLKSDNREVTTYETQQDMGNGTYEVVTVTKSPLDAWLSRSSVIGVVKVY